jgi:hypothetical protein
MEKSDWFRKWIRMQFAIKIKYQLIFSRATAASLPTG